jgi:hypothetical protein
MDAVWDKVLKRLINHAMAYYLRFATKMRADHVEADVTSTSVTGMTGMQGAVVTDFQA